MISLNLLYGLSQVIVSVSLVVGQLIFSSLSLSENNSYLDTEETTSLDEIDGLLKASILSLGGKKVLSNEGGGDCLFHTFSSHLEIDHKQLREDALSQMRLTQADKSDSSYDNRPITT